MFSDFINGFLIELALVVTVGMQSAFILRQGIRAEHVFTAAAVCTLCEWALVSAGIAGMGVVLSSRPALIRLITALGIGFLLFYCVKSLYTAFKSNEALNAETADSIKSGNAWQTALSAAAFSLLNPHVILDTTLMGAFSAKYHPHQWIFGAGVMTAALLWYSFLGTTGRLMAKPLKNPKTWRIINVVIAALCACVAFNFIHDFNSPHEHGDETITHFHSER